MEHFHNINLHLFIFFFFFFPLTYSPTLLPFFFHSSSHTSSLPHIFVFPAISTCSFSLTFFSSSLPCADLGFGRRRGQCILGFFCHFISTGRMMGTVPHTIKSRGETAEAGRGRISNQVLLSL